MVQAGLAAPAPGRVSFANMKPISFRVTLALLAGCALSLCAAPAEYQIHDGDRVVFLGDSITEQRLYTTYIEAYALTRRPAWQLSFRNVGWGGDTAWLRQRAHPDEGRLFAADGDAQQKMVVEAVDRGLERDVLPLKPTLVTVKFGMNDHAYQPFREDIFRAYVRSQTRIAEVLKVHNARIAFLTPQPIEEKRSDPDKDARNQSLRKFSDGLKEVAQAQGATFVDQFDPYMAILLRERAGNPAGMVGGGDAVHPGPIGHTVMAWAILKSLGAPALVSRADLDFTGQKPPFTEHCRIENVKVADGSVSFDRSDEALPMPIDPRAGGALNLAPILEDLSRYDLRITGLPPRAYEVSIDGEPVMKATAGEFAKVVNLAAHAGPITKQAREVLSLVFRKNDLYFNRWRNVQLFDFPNWSQGPEVEAKRKAETDRLDREIVGLESQINAARKPVIHHFQVKPLVQ